jgi:hydroxymethylglutaryl-CoA reductase
LTPVGEDWISAVPLAVTAGILLASPSFAIKLARGGFGAHLLDLGSIRTIEDEKFG